MKKSNLDEMQEQKLLKLEHNGYWLAYAGLIVAILIQGILGGSIREIAGEIVVLLVICLYLIWGCLKHGIWDRRLKANWKTNCLLSLLPGVVMGAFFAIRCAGSSDAVGFLLVIGLIPAVFTFVLCFAALSVCTALYKKRREKLDKE